jgi:hypothetical protein
MASVLPATARALPIEAGVRAGVDVASLNFDGPFSELLETKSKLGPTAGVWVAWSLAPTLAVETGLDWRMKGAQTRDETPYLFPRGDGRARLFWDHRYLEVPVLVRWSMPATGPIRATLAGGPAFAFRVAAELRPEGDDDNTIDQTDALNPVDFGVQAGLGLTLGPAGRWRVDLRYTHGTDDAYDDDRQDGGRHRAFAATLGYVVLR